MVFGRAAGKWEVGSEGVDEKRPRRQQWDDL